MVIRRRMGWTAHFAPAPWAAVLFAVALCASGCTSGDELSAGDAATIAQGSQAEYSVDGGEWTAVGAGDTVPDGAAVRPTDGELALEFRDGTVRLSADASAVVTAQRLTVDRGEALIFSGGALAGAVDDTTVEGQARYRLSSGLSSRVGVYEGAVTVRRPAQEQKVPALRELDLSAFRLSAEEPLHYQEADPWDQELLDTAIAFDGEAARLSRGMDVDLGRRPLRPAFYRQFTKPSAIDLIAAQAPVTRGAAFGPPSDVLLTVFVAEAAATGAVTPAVRRVTDLRAEGARWGLIAMELDVPSDKVVAAIDDLDGGRIAAAERAAADRRAKRNRGSGGSEDGGQVAVADDSGTGSTDAAPDPAGEDGTSGTGETSNDPAPPPNDDPPEEPRDKDPGDKDPDDPGDGPGDDDPDPVEAVARVVNDVVNQGPDVPGGDDDDDILPLP